MGRNFTWFVISLFILIRASGQNKSTTPVSNLRIKYISARSDTVQVDSLSLVPGSLSVKGVSDSSFRLDEPRSILIWLRKPLKDSVQVTYRVFPFSLARDYFHKDSRQLYSSYVLTPYIYKGGGASSSRFIDFGTLDYNGSLARGISFGNAQDVVVNSNLNLQLSGMLADSIQLLAAISDNNIPFQPEGNTESLQNFDKVFIQFSKKSSKLVLGDFDLQQSESHFMHFFERLEGISFSTVFRTAPGDSNAIGVSGAVTEGKFSQNILQGQEGNQGPYLLTGANGEQYVIVLAGTERVYIDGQLLKRGQDQDYTIDYNTAQLTFTPKQLITNDTRIQVEFEYTANNYLNSQLYLTDSWKVGDRLKFNFNAYSNEDAKNSPISQVLDANQIYFLSQLGDSINKAFYPSAAIDTFSSSQVLYALVDTLVKGIPFDTVFIYSTNPDSAHYSLGFTLVGQGNGSYIPLNNGSNGQAYQWVAPVNGVLQGSYAPVVLLVTPKKQQLFTLGADYRINANSSLKAEAALSNNDVNLYSHIQKAGDIGTAGNVAYQSSSVLAKAPKSETDLLSSISYEYVGANFKSLEPFRNVEFYRDWSLGLGTVLPPADENLVDGNLELKKTGLGDFKYEFSGFFRGSTYSGVRNVLDESISSAGFLINGEFNLTTGDGIFGKSVFLRPSLDVSRSFKQLDGIRIGTSFSMQDNQIRSNLGDTLSYQSFAYNTWEVYLKTPDKDRNQIAISFTLRTDSYPLLTRMVKADDNRILNITGQLAKNAHQQLRWNITYHNMQVGDSALSGQQPDQGILGRLEYMVNAAHGFLTTSTVYETGSGQEPRQSYTYVQVPSGQGDYVWIDYNHDSIQQINEFQKAIYADQGDFIRVYTPTDQYVKTNYVRLNQSIALNPKMLFHAQKLKGIALFLSKFNTQSSFQINRDEQAGGLSQFNPFGQNVQDTSLISVTSLITNTVFFNRLSSIWSMDFTSTVNNNKSLMAYGFESSNLSNNMLRARWNLNKRFTAELNAQNGVNSTYSPDYANLKYRINELTLIPQMDYTYSSKLRLTLNYTWDDKVNSPAEGGETSLSNALSTELKYNVLSTSTLDVKFTFNQIAFNGQSSSTVGYTMLNGLLPGQNLLWDLSYSKRIAGNIEMDLQYEGRKPGNTRIIHTGQISVRALF